MPAFLTVSESYHKLHTMGQSNIENKVRTKEKMKGETMVSVADDW